MRKIIQEGRGITRGNTSKYAVGSEGKSLG